MQRGLGERYVADPRFSATYERIRAGLAEFVRDAIRANAERVAPHPARRLISPSI